MKRSEERRTTCAAVPAAAVVPIHKENLRPCVPAFGETRSALKQTCTNFRRKSSQHGCSPPCRFLETQAKEQAETKHVSAAGGRRIYSTTYPASQPRQRLGPHRKNTTQSRKHETGGSGAGKNCRSFLGDCGSRLLCSVFSSS